MTAKLMTLDQVLEEMLQDPEFRQAYDDLEPAYQVARLRIRRGLSQKQLAELVGTKQPSIARLESGQVAPRLSFLKRVVEALGGTLTVHIEASGEMPGLAESETRYNADPPNDPLA
ncbi:MAG: helix-turn-helix domain-containing protein [Anaerolineae bacterium]